MGLNLAFLSYLVMPFVGIFCPQLQTLTLNCVYLHNSLFNEVNFLLRVLYHVWS
jgi:hypothetical protein